MRANQLQVCFHVCGSAFSSFSILHSRLSIIFPHLAGRGQEGGGDRLVDLEGGVDDVGPEREDLLGEPFLVEVPVEDGAEDADQRLGLEIDDGDLCFIREKGRKEVKYTFAERETE
jgi:hypothetical protein